MSPRHLTHPPHHLTGAELQTLREACHLSRDELGSLCGVAPRTVKHWESGRAGVPADVADVVARLDATIQHTADQGAAVIEQAMAHQGTAPADVVLMRYRTPGDLARYRPDMAGAPAGAHGAIVARLRAQALALGVAAVRVVWMDPSAYEAWRAAQGLPDAEPSRAAWAADQVQAQALPHRGDQPPG